MNKKILSLVVILVLLGGVLSLAAPAKAQFGVQQTGPYLGLEYGTATGLGQEEVRFTTARIISAILGLLGIISLVIILYAGFKWMTSGGNEEDVKSAQKILTAAVVGLIIIMSAYAITRFVMTQLFKATAGYDYSTTLDGY